MKMSCLSLVASAAVLMNLAGTAAAQAQPADKAPAKSAEKAAVKAGKPVNQTCPITGEEIDGETTMAYKGQTLGFCCPGCDTKFEKKTAAEKDAFLGKFVKVSAEQPAKEGSAPAKAAPAKEAAKAAAGAAVNTLCVMTQEEVDAKSPTTSYEGKTYAFCCKSCVKKFNALSDEAKDKKIAVVMNAATQPKDMSHHTVLTGTLVDMACYLKGEKMGNTKEDAACFESCVVEKGMPAGLLVKEGGKERLFILMSETPAKELYKGQFGKTVHYCGDAYEKDGIRVLFVEHAAGEDEMKEMKEHHKGQSEKH
jgi:YHS domain-containing protein